MNDNLDDFLNSLGITQDVTETMESPVVHDPERSAVANGDLPPEEPHYSLADDELDDILSGYGFQNAPEESVEEGREEEEESTSSESLEDERNTFNVAAATSFIRRNIGWAVPTFVSNEELVNIGDFRVNPYTERVEMLTDNGIVSVGQEFIDRETRDLDAEEDADWQEAIDSGSVVPVPNFDVTVREPENINPHLMEMADSILSEVSAPQEESLLPLNSPTLLMDESTTRFSGAEWFNEIQKKSIIVAGCGGIGSWLILQLARMKPAALFLYDDDMVETVNMAGQLYARNDVGKSKVSAISDMITAYTNMQNVYAIQDRFTDSTEPGDIMICGFDNMEARRTFFFKWQAHVIQKPVEERKNCLYLDGRLSMTDLQVLCITGDNGWAQSEYESKYLFSDEEAEHTVCSMKQTTYLACMIGSIMVNLFTNFCANLLDPVIPYDLPFFTEYDAQNMIFKTIK